VFRDQRIIYTFTAWSVAGIIRVVGASFWADVNKLDLLYQNVKTWLIDRLGAKIAHSYLQLSGTPLGPSFYTAPTSLIWLFLMRLSLPASSSFLFQLFFNERVSSYS
jgi:hypothetical protein